MPKRKRIKEPESEEVPLPSPEEGTMLGVIQQFLGYDRARVLCVDGKIRLCRIPGKYKKRMWMRIGDVVLVSPWDFQKDTRGDIIFRYRGSDLQKLEKEGYLEELKKLLEVE
ncbi:MAG TPA: translation initiation factor IF-1A [Thermofilum sp.]|nr:MAG: translation initiation factor eIF-1A [Thermoprotei archaeon]HDI32000.1 translation initiation factor IF-1A [Thermofilum sp.]